MGMDLYIFKAKSKKAFEEKFWYDSDNVKEVYYARKFWDLVQNCKFIPKDYENGDYIRLTKENVEELITVACHNRDYFDTFNSVPALCEILDHFDEEEEAGWQYFLEYDW